MDSMFKILSKLDDWRHLPAYQLERRVDIFFGLLLPEFFESAFGVTDATVIPEFPLRKGDLDCKHKDDNRSVKVDFAVFGYKNKEGHMYLVELKTDMESLNTDQLCNMLKAKRLGLQRLLRGVKQVANATSSKSKQKYEHLLAKLTKFKKWGSEEIDLLLISPKEPECVPDKVKQLLTEFRCITFDQFSRHMEGRNREFEPEAMQVLTLYLDRWASVPAGRAATKT